MKGTTIGLTEKVTIKSETKKKTVLATYMRDPELGLTSYDVWVERKRAEVAGTLSPHMNEPFRPEDIQVSGLGPIIWTSCPNCRNPINSKSKVCGICGVTINPN